MRAPLLAFAIVVVIVLLAALQAVASIALRDEALAGAWPRFVPSSTAARLDGIPQSVPLPPALALVLAREALAHGDRGAAAAFARRLGPSRDLAALQGDIADARGDTAGAVRAYLAAGDRDGIERHVSDLVAAGRVTDAVALQRALVARLASERAQADALAEASFELGGVEELGAYRLLVGSVPRRDAETRALEAYRRAVALAPLEERYLIAFGNQELNVDDISAAERAFERARDVDPTSAEPLAGLGDAAFSRDDPARARAYLAQARARNAASDAVRNLARELGE